MTAQASDQEALPLGSFRSLRHLPTWLVIGLMWSAAQLPYALQLRIGKSLGWISYHLARARRRVCETNLKLCFPDLSDGQHQALVRKTFAANGIALIEIAIAWFGRFERYQRLLHMHGLHNLQEAFAQGRGVLLLGSHQTSFEIVGFLARGIGDINITYRANDKDPLFDAIMLHGRRRTYGGVYERNDIRGMMRCLKRNGGLWYAPDQDFGARHSVFVPFFGVPAATITAGSRLVKFNQSPVIPISFYRRADGSGYDLYFGEPLEDFPSGDDDKDGRILSAVAEQAIRRQPDQYLWLHKRFKTPPPGTDRNPYV